MRKDREVHGLMKIPAEVIISELRIELGKTYSEVDGLTDSNKMLERMCADLESTLANKLAYIEKLELEVKRQQKANTKLLKSILKIKRGC